LVRFWRKKQKNEENEKKKYFVLSLFSCCSVKEMEEELCQLQYELEELKKILKYD